MRLTTDEKFANTELNEVQKKKKTPWEILR